MISSVSSDSCHDIVGAGKLDKKFLILLLNNMFEECVLCKLCSFDGVNVLVLFVVGKCTVLKYCFHFFNRFLIFIASCFIIHPKLEVHSM